MYPFVWYNEVHVFARGNCHCCFVARANGVYAHEIIYLHIQVVAWEKGKQTDRSF